MKVSNWVWDFLMLVTRVVALSRELIRYRIELIVGKGPGMKSMKGRQS